MRQTQRQKDRDIAILVTALSIFLGFFVLYAAFTTWLLMDESQANKTRHAAENFQFVCFDGPRIAYGDKFTECKSVIVRDAKIDNKHVL